MINLLSGAGTRDEPLRTPAGEASNEEWKGYVKKKTFGNFFLDF